MNCFEPVFRYISVAPVRLRTVFFKGMKHINHSSNLRQIHDSIPGAGIVGLQFPNAFANGGHGTHTAAREFAVLKPTQRKTKCAFHFGGKGAEDILRVAFLRNFSQRLAHLAPASMIIQYIL